MTDAAIQIDAGNFIDTLSTVDDLGRPTQVIDPKGNVTTYKYYDKAKLSAVRVTPAAGPVQIAMTDRTTGDELAITMTPVGPGESQDNILKSLTRTRTDLAGRTVSSDRYASVSSVRFPQYLSLSGDLPFFTDTPWGSVNVDSRATP